MRARELVKETFFRKSFIIRAHVVWMSVYVLFFLLLVSIILPGNWATP